MDETWIDVGGIDDIPLQGARTVQSDGPPVAVFRTAAGEVHALVNRCPHLAGPLSEGIVAGRTVTCPLHNWVIDLASGEAVLPDVGTTPTVSVRVVAGRVLLSATALKNGTSSAAHAACRNASKVA